MAGLAFPELCAVRWCGAYLCGLGKDWSVGNRARKRLELFFSGEMYSARGVLQWVTWKESEENENHEVISVKWLGDELTALDLSGETTTAYASRIHRYCLCDTRFVDWFSFEIDSLISSYPAFIADRGHRTANLVHSVILAKHLGVEKLRGSKGPTGVYYRHMFMLMFGGVCWIWKVSRRHYHYMNSTQNR